jgi:hypothetical protein
MTTPQPKIKKEIEMKTYRAVVTSYSGSTRKSKWYQSWAEAQRAGDRLADGNTKSIGVYDQTRYRY